MKILLITLLTTILVLISNGSYAQTKENVQDESYSYAYVSVEGKLFSKKLRVSVDFGDPPEQIKAGNEYSDYLTNKKSYAAVLNHMIGKQFELVNTLELTSSYQGSGETSGIVFIMKRKIEDKK